MGSLRLTEKEAVRLGYIDAPTPATMQQPIRAGQRQPHPFGYLPLVILSLSIGWIIGFACGLWFGR